MNIKYMITALLIALATAANAQIRFPDINQNTSSSAASSAFLDASSNAINNGIPNVAKGIIYPRVDLSTFVAFGGAPIGAPSSYPTQYDGFMVYNTKVGGVAGVGATQGTLTAGYWFYENKSTRITDGIWKPLGVIDNPWKNLNGTIATSVSDSIVFKGTSVGINVDNPEATLEVNGSVKLSNLSSTNIGSNLLIEDGIGNVQKISLDDLKVLINKNTIPGTDIEALDLQTIASGLIHIDDVRGSNTTWRHDFASSLINTNTTVTLPVNLISSANLKIDFKVPLPSEDYIVIATVKTISLNLIGAYNYQLNVLVADKTKNGFTLNVLEEKEGGRENYIEYIVMYDKSRAMAVATGPNTFTKQQYHTALLSDKGAYAATSLSMYATNHLAGNITLNGDLRTDALKTSDVKYYGEFGQGALNSQTNTRSYTSDNVFHKAICPDNRIVTGIQIYATTYLDGYMKVQCTALNPGYTTQPSPGVIDTQGPGVNDDNKVHFTKCPAGQYVQGVRIYSTPFLDGDMGLYCTPIIKN
ncbi:hypothetical protein SAMN05216324_13513 [Chryseobacterium limigenitum]|uniref:Uncharacterized protein n=2 Tax=Chryseobacterium limigenitum TaxID=1612149 RepID=A0A1K2IX80_9FLAO|nr:hypothetical protein SAMN05216324_13513 [Chryseobacterium limigenitum]